MEFHQADVETSLQGPFVSLKLQLSMGELNKEVCEYQFRNAESLSFIVLFSLLLFSNCWYYLFFFFFEWLTVGIIWSIECLQS